ncbi:hypothetical protein [Streptomyces kanamyceticus]|uniref:hypothetical protein n=1 Tax=Streptomyces kanamyceticus TaxID=1967 RepID=UPI00168CBEE4|nr:hypothetical protein [Streptomyces kanamyceticus]
MTDELNTLPAAPHVKVDDELETERWMGCSPQSSNAELVALVATQALLGLSSEARRRLRYAHRHLATMFPHLPQQSGTTTKRAHPPRPLIAYDHGTSDSLA